MKNIKHIRINLLIPFSIFFCLPPDNLGQRLDVCLDHLFASWGGVLWEVHGDQPVIVVASLEENLVRRDFAVHSSARVAASKSHRRAKEATLRKEVVRSEARVREGGWRCRGEVENLRKRTRGRY